MKGIAMTPDRKEFMGTLGATLSLYHDLEPEATQELFRQLNLFLEAIEAIEVTKADIPVFANRLVGYFADDDEDQKKVDDTAQFVKEELETISADLPPGETLNLYWVTTDDAAEDWFVIENSLWSAAREFEDAEGYNLGDACAEYVCQIPDEYQGVEPGWPSAELFRVCGFRCRLQGATRVIEFDGRVYCEGWLEDEVCKARDELFDCIQMGRIQKRDSDD
jgi:hypothetical protein